MKRQKLLTLILATVTLASCQFENFDERCAREAKEYTEMQCPRRMDPYTVMDSMTYCQADKSLNYYYTLEDTLDNAAIFTPEIVSGFREQVRKELANSVQMKKYKEEKMTFNYIYLSQKSGKPHLKLSFKPADYQKAE